MRLVWAEVVRLTNTATAVIRQQCDLRLQALIRPSLLSDSSHQCIHVASFTYCTFSVTFVE
jgi:hypothetical protein